MLNVESEEYLNDLLKCFDDYYQYKNIIAFKAHQMPQISITACYQQGKQYHVKSYR